MRVGVLEFLQYDGGPGVQATYLLGGARLHNALTSRN